MDQYGCETWSLTLREESRLRVFENGALRRLFASERNEVTGEWRKLHNEELNVLYSSPIILSVITSRRMRWAGHVECMGRGEVYTGFWWGNLGQIENLEDSGLYRRIVLRWICRNWDVRPWTGSSWLRIGAGGGHL